MADTTTNKPRKSPPGKPSWEVPTFNAATLKGMLLGAKESEATQVSPRSKKSVYAPLYEFIDGQIATLAGDRTRFVLVTPGNMPWDKFRDIVGSYINKVYNTEGRRVYIVSKALQDKRVIIDKVSEST